MQWKLTNHPHEIASMLALPLFVIMYLLKVVSDLLKVKTIKTELSPFTSIPSGPAKPVKIEIRPWAKQSSSCRAVIDFLAKLGRNEACGKLAFPLIRLHGAELTRERS